MKMLDKIKGWWDRMFGNKVKEEFKVKPILSPVMEIAIMDWIKTYKGYPGWVNSKDGVKTINFAKAVCSEAANLTTLDLGIELDGGERAAYLQNRIDHVLMPHLREWTEYGCAFGTVIFKPNGEGADIVTPDRFWVVNRDGNGQISGVVFEDNDQDGDKYYTKLEYHRYLRTSVKMPDGESKDTVYYTITNKTYKSDREDAIGKPCPIEETKWKNLMPEANITKKNGERLNSMLFGVFRMPKANNIDLNSPMGMALFSDAMQEMEDLDVAYSRNAAEIFDSESIELLDDRLIQQAGHKVGDQEGKLKLPHHVHNVYGQGMDTFYQAIERPIRTDLRLKGIDNLLSQAGYKCGFSNGYFVLDAKTGMITATQVEADDRRTIQTIKDIRDSLQKAIDDYLYAESVFADIYGQAPVGEYEVNYSFGDITYNFEEDKLHHYQLATNGKYPWEEYYVKFLKYSRKEARRLLQMAREENLQAKEKGLFEDEE